MSCRDDDIKDGSYQMWRKRRVSGQWRETLTVGISDRDYNYQSIYTLFTISERDKGDIMKQLQRTNPKTGNRKVGQLGRREPGTDRGNPLALDPRKERASGNLSTFQSQPRRVGRTPIYKNRRPNATRSRSLRFRSARPFGSAGQASLATPFFFRPKALLFETGITANKRPAEQKGTQMGAD